MHLNAGVVLCGTGQQGAKWSCSDFFEPSPVYYGTTRELFKRMNCGFVHIIPTALRAVSLKYLLQGGQSVSKSCSGLGLRLINDPLTKYLIKSYLAKGLGTKLQSFWNEGGVLMRGMALRYNTFLLHLATLQMWCSNVRLI